MFKLYPYDIDNLIDLLRLVKEAEENTASGELVKGDFIATWPEDDSAIIIRQQEGGGQSRNE